MNVNSVLFVCTANMCRSPFAEGVLKRLLARAGRDDVVVSSAGVQTSDGNSALSKAISTALRFEVDISGHSSRQITKSIISENDLIIVMENTHTNLISTIDITSLRKVKLLTSFRENGGKGYNVPDPHGHGDDVYFEIFSEINRYVRILAKQLWSVE